MYVNSYRRDAKPQRKGKILIALVAVRLCLPLWGLTVLNGGRPAMPSTIFSILVFSFHEISFYSTYMYLRIIHLFKFSEHSMRGASVQWQYSV